MNDKFLIINTFIQIPMQEIDFSFARSSGPGGQNVNKTNSQAVLKWNILETTCLEPELKTQIMTKLKNRINKNGELVLQSDQFRDQPKNTQDCLDRLIELISLAAHKPKKRTPTKPTRGSKERRLTGKKMQADKKKMRKVDYD